MNWKKTSILTLFLILTASIAVAQSLRVPSTVEITPESKEFEVKVTNDTNKLQNAAIALLAPLEYTINPTPISLSAYSSQTFKIKLNPTNDQSGQTLKAAVIATVGKETVKRNVEITISGDFSKKAADNKNQGTGFFTLAGLPDLGQAVDILLIIVIIVLVIAIVARLLRKSKKEEFQ